MSSCVIPVVFSPGWLRLDYIHSTQSIMHGTRARFLFGVDPQNFPLMLSTADDWAEALRGLYTNAFIATGFTVLRQDGTVSYAAALSAPITGAHSAASGGGDYASRTVTFTGRGVPGSAAECTGEAISRVFVGGAFEFISRQKFLVSGADAGADAYADFLRDSGIIWADFYGQDANLRGTYPVQFNSYQQRRNGT